MSTETNPSLSANKQALLRIRELKQQLEAARRDDEQGEPIAVVSMACRFPRRSRTPEQFWQSLLDQTDEAGEVPEDRWDLEAFYDADPEAPGKMYARDGVFLDRLDEMDPEFFGISPREATWVDPQQRLLLEVGWEALERAGWLPEAIGEHTGVFVGWMHNDYQNEASDSFLNLNPYIATGAAGSFLCGRLAYYLGLEGPSLAVDTACSSSLVALHLACQSLQRRDCDRALVGGVNVICSPTTNILTCKLKALSPSGHSRAFDAAADGYLRGEGCGVVTVRRLADAQRDGDPVLAVIRGSAIGHNGFSSGLTAPNPKAQQKVIRQAVARAGIEAADVAYLEAHGTGTELGDPIEMQAAAAALGEGRCADNPLLVGSVKTNIGHLEAAAGMAGLIKVLLALKHGKIPGQLNFETPNPHIAWDQIPVRVLTDATPWPDADRRVAGVSAFGMSGTNAHVVVAAPPAATGQAPPRPISGADAAAVAQGGGETHLDEARGAAGAAPQLIPLSGHSEQALQDTAEQFQAYFSSDGDASLAEVAGTAGAHRRHFQHRLAMVVGSSRQAAETLGRFTSGLDADTLFHAARRDKPKVGWQFTGQGAQFPGMARRLYECEPVFRKTIDDCDALLRQWRGESLKDVLYGDDEAEIHDTRWTQPGMFALQMGLARWLQEIGLAPHAVLGHSVGQYAAACVAGMLSWEDGLRLISERGRLIGDLPQGGRMLAVFAPLEAVQDQLEAAQNLSLAALNGTHLVVSGADEDVAAMQAEMEQRGVRCKALTTSHAFHSSLMDPALDEFAKIADTVAWRPPHLPLLCNVTGQPLPPDQTLDGGYWARHIRQPVRYADNVAAAAELGCDVLLEIGPQPVLSRMAVANWPAAGSGASNLISCLQRDADDRESLLRAVAQLYVLGQSPDFERLQGGRRGRVVSLPTYPFQRRRFWGPDKPRAHHAEFHTAHPLLGNAVALAGVQDESRFESFLEPDSPPWIVDHEVMGQVVLPGAAFIELGLAASPGRPLADVVFHRPLQPKGRTHMQTVVRGASSPTIETYARVSEAAEWSLHFTARAAETPAPAAERMDRQALEAACGDEVEPADFYQKMQEIGLNYGPEFQTIRALRHSDTEVLARLETTSDIRGFTAPPPLLDGALHCLAVGLLREDDGSLFLPVGAERIVSRMPIAGPVWCHAKWNETSGDSRTADLTLFDDEGAVLLEIQGLKVQQMDRAVLRRMSGVGAERLLFDMQWTAQRLGGVRTADQPWLIVCDRSRTELAEAVAAQLRSPECPVIITQLAPGDFGEDGPERFTIDSTSEEQWSRLLAAADDKNMSPAGVAWVLHDDDREDAGPQGESLTEATQANCRGMLQLIAALQAARRPLEFGLQLITTNGVQLEADADCDAEQAKYWGLGRVIGAERPDLRCRLIDVSGEDDDPSPAVAEILARETRDNQWAVRDSQYFVPRMKQARVLAGGGSKATARPDRSYLVTGGLGMLGRLAAQWLAEQGAGQLILVSRRPPDETARALLREIEAGATQVVVHPADISDPAAVAEMFARFDAEWLPLGGVIHAAGLLDDALLADQSWRRFEQVLQPKVAGARLLHQYTRSLPLDFFVFYSSAASVLGSPGQSNYATANAYLDGLAWHRRAQGLPATVINWGPWSEGMADDPRILKRLALQGITPLSVDEAHQAMQAMLDGGLVQATAIDVDWRRMQLGLGAEAPPMLDQLAPARRRSQQAESALVAKLKQLPAAARKELLVSTVQESLQRILDTPEPPELDRPLIEMGLDSLMAVEFGSELQQMLGDQFAVGPTMLFDHPTVDAIAEHVLELVAGESADAPGEDAGGPAPEQGEDAAAKAGELRQRELIAIVGMSCRFPGAESVEEFWQNILNGVDSVTDIPDDRWDIDRFYSESREPGKMYTREGGFLPDIGDFDASFFNISPQEACWIDPQHRLLLENSYRALEDAGIPLQPLKDANVGVFMGLMGQDYAFLPRLEDESIVQAFEGAGLSHSAGVGRISYMFGFEGPSMAVDTASSSSLVALLQAVRSLQDGQCNMALAGGVNAILAPVNSLLMSKAGLLAPDGRCKSFSAAADGFGRGEGCGVVALKRLSDARRDGDRVLAVIRGGAVVHNGTSSAITAPSGKSQTRVIQEALADAQLAPSQVQYLEAHGTGTEFGDPLELGAAAAAYGKGRQRDQPLLVGSVKPNISHLEAAGGVSGLIKTVLAIHHGVIPPQIHFDEPSPHIPWKRLPLRVVDEPTPWPATEERVAGVTALGLVGTNAHVLLSSPPSEAEADAEAPSPPPPERDAHLLVLSARSRSALAALADRYRALLTDPSTSAEMFPDICHTAGAGRRHLECRMAVAATSARDAADKLERLAPLPGVGEELQVGAGWAVGRAGAVPKITWIFPAAGDELAPRAWQTVAELYRFSPDFRRRIGAFDDILQAADDSMPRLAEHLSEHLAESSAEDPPRSAFAAAMLEDARLPAFLLQAGLAELWQAWGVEPDGLWGAGAGQLVAASVAGALSMEDALLLAVEGAKARHALAAGGESDRTGVLEAFEAYADQFNFYPPNIPLVCSVTGEVVPVHRSLGGSYWRQQLTADVESDASAAARKLGGDEVLELGRVGSGQAPGPSQDDAATVWSVPGERPLPTALLDTMARMYAAGVALDFAAFDAPWDRQRVSLPGYPFEKQRYWITEIADHQPADEVMQQ